MTGRPCTPDADLKGLWRMLLGTPFPACGITEAGDAANSEGAESERAENQSAEASATTVVSKA
jgi:hypothetical protein